MLKGALQITFTTDQPGPPTVGIDELFFVKGALTQGRRRNGDETSQGQALRLPATDLAEAQSIESACIAIASF